MRSRSLGRESVQVNIIVWMIETQSLGELVEAFGKGVQFPLIVFAQVCRSKALNRKHPRLMLSARPLTQ